MVKWIVELNEFDIFYHPRSSMKAQVIANLLAEHTWSDDKPIEAPAE